MLSNDEIQQLKSENRLLQIQLNDINEMINIREEELDILRKKAAYTISLQSTLDGNLEEIVQMQSYIGEQQRKVAGSVRREAAMENEIVQSLEMEKEFYTMRDKYESARAAITDLDNELAETSSMYRQLAASNTRVAELESSLEIALMENDRLKEKIEKLTPRQE
jgi:chromosome segregation ATPase